ncbi:hypothetical protein TorRG33x02_115110 [Trema orientale]|uniref:Uncharacterized protein n=1 Tax=Trema orientale TaxID=63057 RepID=A0A2P5F4D0_TREOI|nr:hypothetical protein TorRG33x02_115110 [Trema orientale]
MQFPRILNCQRVEWPKESYRPALDRIWLWPIGHTFQPNGALRPNTTVIFEAGQTWPGIGWDILELKSHF